MRLRGILEALRQNGQVARQNWFSATKVTPGDGKAAHERHDSTAGLGFQEGWVGLAGSAPCFRVFCSHLALRPRAQTPSLSASQPMPPGQAGLDGWVDVCLTATADPRWHRRRGIKVVELPRRKRRPQRTSTLHIPFRYLTSTWTLCGIFCRRALLSLTNNYLHCRLYSLDPDSPKHNPAHPPLLEHKVLHHQIKPLITREIEDLYKYLGYHIHRPLLGIWKKSKPVTRILAISATTRSRSTQSF
jgi:hypothetical protein